MKNLRADSSVVELPLFQGEDGGAIPTSALQLLLRPIRHDTAFDCYCKWHYLGGNGFLASFNFGAYFNGEILGAISYGIPNAKNIKGIYSQKTQSEFFELTRLALSELCPKFSESRVISVSMRMLKKLNPSLRGVITYADTEQNHTGTIYKASNFTYIGLTAQKTDLFVDGKKIGKLKGVKYSEIKGEWRKRSRKHLFVRYFKGNKEESA